MLPDIFDRVHSNVADPAAEPAGSEEDTSRLTGNPPHEGKENISKPKDRRVSFPNLVKLKDAKTKDSLKDGPAGSAASSGASVSASVSSVATVVNLVRNTTRVKEVLLGRMTERFAGDEGINTLGEKGRRESHILTWNFEEQGLGKEKGKKKRKSSKSSKKQGGENGDGTGDGDGAVFASQFPPLSLSGKERMTLSEAVANFLESKSITVLSHRHLTRTTRCMSILLRATLQTEHFYKLTHIPCFMNSLETWGAVPAGAKWQQILNELFGRCDAPLVFLKGELLGNMEEIEHMTLKRTLQEKLRLVDVRSSPPVRHVISVLPIKEDFENMEKARGLKKIERICRTTEGKGHDCVLEHETRRHTLSNVMMNAHELIKSFAVPN